MNTIHPNLRIDADKVLDVRGIPCSVKHGFIVESFQRLAVGDHFVLLNDHDPAHLRTQFTGQWPGAFAWDYVTKTDDEVRVKITKIQPTAPAALAPPDCCGGH
jgi:uncharacterized protein (DUF2249 family)